MHGGFARSIIGLRAAAGVRHFEMERDPSSSFKMNSEQRRNYSPGYHRLTQPFVLQRRPRSPPAPTLRGSVHSVDGSFPEALTTSGCVVSTPALGGNWCHVACAEPTGSGASGTTARVGEP